ncbi:hypothetical protein E2K93_00495 [Thalassotalea sp. HSM 43]|uniref:hypothetical protein n=1 Tax=Thalassotalea sp. HSM 43 TaxID=2552945 RepID=UPI0010802287|nr:hypothetical protein [Thalassotalea sp. HSM 43]QBY02941.1 hypothetical protein E2K93_00495 [Thalassotalea sp. HSM 43]
MKKLLKLKEWLTPEEAVAYISTEIGEKVFVSDLYRFAIDEHLTLSVNFVNQAKVKVGQVVKIHHSELRTIEGNNFTDEELSEPSTLPLDHHIHLSGDDWLALTTEVTSISGIWDLTMLGSEILDIENYYQQLTSGLKVTLTCLEGVLVKQGDVYCQLQTNFYDICNDQVPNKIIEDEQDKRNVPFYSPSGSLDDYDYVFVIRTAEVNRIAKLLEGSSHIDKPLTTNERNSLLIVIGALCKELNIDPNQRGISTSVIAMTELIGAPLNVDTVRKILNQIEPAISSRSK